MHLTWDPLRGCFILTVLLSLWMEVTSGFVIQRIPESPAVGQNVTLKVTGVTGTVFGVSWYKGSGTDSQNLILFYIPDSNIERPGPQYFSRASPLPDGSLQISDLVTSDRGNYTAQIQADTQLQYTVYLPVYDILTPPSLTGPPSPSVNGTNVTLHCNAGGQAVLNYTFIRDQQSVSCAQHHVTCSESSPFLYFRPIIESDSGNYTCTIQNPVSNSSSAPVRLSVAVSVSAVTLHSNASGPVLVEKDSVSLTCSALGTDVSFSWSLRGALLPQNPRYKLTPNNSTLIISPVTRNDTGSFTCTASNSVNNETSAPLNLTWSPDGHIVCAAGRPGQRVQLLCSWPGGYPAADLHLQFYNLTETRQDQVTINVSQDQITPDTELSCRGTQAGREETCALTIDTPQSAGFKNSSQVTGTLGKSVILTVTLTNGRAVLPLQLPASIPTPQILPANFTWSRLTPEPSPLPLGGNFTVESSDYGSRLVVSPVTESVAGRYQCRAENLMGSTSFIFILNVTAEKVSAGSRLGPGEIAGIVIGVLAGVTLIAIIVFFIVKPKKRITEYAAVYRNSANTGEAEKKQDNEDEVKYADLRFQAKGPVQTQSPLDSETEYSTVKAVSKR
ncbi:cell adhesion molecule CEACAM6-like isoform X2 [Ascaphus truei]|uniref:cell adhesion molecule CEACAM6-like isoform X2 n=1 Tax=Ascaphus truei TaxID=8439 RepID=UPI003F5A6BA9